MICRKYSCQKLSQFSQGNNVLDAPASNLDGFLCRDTCVPQVCWIGLLRANTTYFHLETPKFQVVSLSKRSQFSQGKICSMLMLLTQMVFFRELHVFPQLTWLGVFGETWATVHLKNCNLLEIFTSKQLIWHGKNAITVPASNIYGFPWRDQCVSTSLLNGPFCKMSLPPMWNIWFEGSIPFQNYLNSHGKTKC
jgi:hypothetical protein